MQFGGSPKCPRCNKSVYFNERFRALGQDWHKSCFTCTNCNKGLELGKQSEHDDQPYCQTCFNRLFGPKGYGFGVGAGLLQETGLEKDGTKKDYRINKDVPADSDTSPKERTWGTAGSARKSVKAFVPGPGNTCPVCEKTVGFAEKISALGCTFHKDCFRCESCNKTLNTGNFNDKDGQVYCKPCYGKNFGPKGYGYSGAVSH